MPFPGHVSCITVLFHYFCKGWDLLGNLPAIPGAVFVNRSHPPQAHGMLMAASQKRSPAWAAASRIFEMTEPDPASGQGINVGGIDLAAIAPQIGIPHVIAHD